jgi:hypothetical protein
MLHNQLLFVSEFTLCAGMRIVSFLQKIKLNEKLRFWVKIEAFLTNINILFII